MRRLLALSVILAAAFAVQMGRAAGPAPLAGAPVRTVSMVVPDADRFGAAWADVLGVPMPKVLEYPGLVFPAGYDASAYPRIVNFRMANVAISMHQPAGGRSYWKDLLDAHGPSLYRMNFQVPDLPATVSALERLGGRLVARTTEGAGINVSLWPPFGFAVELGARPAGPPPAAQATATLTGFAANSVATITIVVGDVRKAVQPYAAIFGAPVPIVGTRRATTTAGRGVALKAALIDLPGDLDLELVQSPNGDNPWRAHQERHGSRALFSVGVRVPSVAAAVAHLTARGGIVKASDPAGRVALVDLTDRLGVRFELQELATR